MTDLKEFSLDIPRLVKDDDESIEAYVDSLPREAVVLSLHTATRIRRALSQFEKMATSRIEGEQILSQAEVWTAPDGKDYFWSGDRHREVKEPAPLKTALTALSSQWGTLAKRALAAAFKPQDDKVYLTELDKIVKYAVNDDEVIQTIKSFVTWTDGYPHLRPVEEERK